MNRAQAPEEAVRVEAERPTTGELIKLIEAEGNLVKAEAITQRSYQLVNMLSGGKATEKAGAYEAF